VILICCFQTLTELLQTIIFKYVPLSAADLQEWASDPERYFEELCKDQPAFNVRLAALQLVEYVILGLLLAVFIVDD